MTAALIVHASLMLGSGFIAGLAVLRVVRRDLPWTHRVGSLAVTTYSVAQIFAQATLLYAPLTVRTISAAVSTLVGLAYAITLLRDSQHGH